MTKNHSFFFFKRYVREILSEHNKGLPSDLEHYFGHLSAYCFFSSSNVKGIPDRKFTYRVEISR